MRAGPFSDERIIRLANRRFIPFYFDLSNRGVAGDPDARAFVVKAKPVLGGARVPTPPVLLMNAEGEVLGEVSNYATPDAVLALMLRTLEKHPEFNRATEAERKLETSLDRARLRFELFDLAGARKVLGKPKTDAGRYLLARIARFQKKFDEAVRILGTIREPSLAAHVHMERAYGYWYAEDFKGLARHLGRVSSKSPRFTEARYYLGLAQFHQGQRKKALATWKACIQGCSQDPWVYRADWAYTAVHQGNQTSFSSARRGASLLKRIGYMGGRNPDLQGPFPSPGR